MISYLRNQRFQISVFLLIASAVLVAGFAAFQIKALRHLTDRTAEFHATTGEIKRLDEVLTSSAQLAATTGQKVWADRYQANATLLDEALARALKLGGADSRRALEAVSAANQALIGIESAAIAQSSQAPSIEAYRQLTSPRYTALKQQYERGVNQALADAKAKLATDFSKARAQLIVDGCILLLVLGALAVQFIIALKQNLKTALKLEAVEAKNAHITSLMETMPAPFALFDKDFRFIQVNQRWKDQFWSDGRNNVGKTLGELHPKQPEAHRQNHARVLAGETVSLDEQFYDATECTGPWLSWTLSPWRDKEGAVIGAQCVAFDISQQVHEREKLRHNKVLLEAMQELSSIGAAEINVATAQTWFSKEMYRIFNLDPAQSASPWDMAVMLPEDDREAFIKAFRTCAKSGIPFDMERLFTLKDGVQRWVRFRVRRDGDIATGRLIAAVQDVTDHKSIEVDLGKAVLRAEDASKSKSAFLANVSHEIRTPLNGVIGITGALAKTDLHEKQREMVDLVLTSGKTLERLLNDILDLSKIEAGHLNIEVAPFDLHKAVDDASQLMRVKADDKGIAFNTNYGLEARGYFEGDVVRLKQIISNLASNAIKFTETGSVTIDVEAVESAIPGEPSKLTISVTDTGIGFDDEAALRLFQRFEQADSSITRKFGGTGLGLSISKSLCEMMGGTLTATSEPGIGSCFTAEIYLDRSMPLADFDRRTENEANDDQEFAGTTEEGETIRVLLAEDHPVNQKVVQLILAPYGIDLTIVENGKEAVDILSVTTFDVVLMDMQMPVMDGLEAVRVIRAHEAANGKQRTPIAMLTANAMADHKDEAALAGADFHISKPITPESLLSGIESTMALGHAASNHTGDDAIDRLLAR